MLDCVRIAEAKRRLQAGKPFKIRLERAPNPSCSPSQWWEAAWEHASNSFIAVNYGATGTYGMSEPEYWDARQPEMFWALVESQFNIPGWRYAPETLESLDLIPLSGPFMEIRRIERLPDRCDAFDANGSFMMSLTLEGARAVAAADPFRITFRDY